MSGRSPGRQVGTDPAEEAPDRLFTIGELADEFEVTTRTIRFYESKGLITPGRRGVARCYTRRDRARLALVLRGKNLGFKLEDVRAYIELYDADPGQEAQTRHLIEKVEAHIARLKRKRADIERTLRELKTIRAEAIEHLRVVRGRS